VPRVWPLISQVAFRSHAGGAVFNIAGVLEVHEPCLPRILPGPDARFVSPFSAFRAADSREGPPEPSVPCWRTVATLYPLGNCDPLKPETCLSCLTRLGTVSHRSSPLSPFFAFTDGARTPPEELVNPASITLPCGFIQEGLGQPAWPDLSPVTWDYPRNLRPPSFVGFNSSGVGRRSREHASWELRCVARAAAGALSASGAPFT
jgi:hypothetical protein